MSDITLRSLVYTNFWRTPISITIPRDAIQTLFPHSILASALQLDPTVENIDIPNADVTPKSLSAIKYMAENKDFPTIKALPEYAKAGNYLGIDSLALLSDPQFEANQRINAQYGPGITGNLLIPDRSKYRNILEHALVNRMPALRRYIFGLFPADDTQEEDEFGLVRASKLGDIIALNDFLQRGVDPGANENSAIRHAARSYQGVVIGQLLKDPRVDPSAKDNEALKSAAHNGDTVMIRRLLQDPRVDPSAANHQIPYDTFHTILND